MSATQRFHSLQSKQRRLNQRAYSVMDKEKRDALLREAREIGRQASELGGALYAYGKYGTSKGEA